MSPEAGSPGMRGILLVLNAGSSSLKVPGFAAPPAGPEPRFSGQVEGIGGAPHLVARNAAGERLADHRWEDGDAPANHADALGVIVRGLDQALHGEAILAIGHRVVHGGTDFAAPMRIDAATMAALERLVPLAPLHQPHNLV